MSSQEADRVMIMRQASEEVNSIISANEKTENKLRKAIQGVNKSDFKKYKPLYEGLRQ